MEGLKKELQKAVDLVTIQMIKSMTYGDEIRLTDDYVLYHYSSDDIITVVLSEEWEEVVQLMYDDNKIIVEVLNEDLI